jgi:Spy/CpxP family protein refolding chaperone
MTEFFYLVSLARRALLMATVLIASCCALWAQPDGSMGPPPDGPPPGGMQAPIKQDQLRGPDVERQLKRLTQLLTLSEAQQARVKAILTDQRQQIEALVKPPKSSSETSSPSSAGADKTASSAASDEDQPPDREVMEALQAAVKSIHKETRAKIAAVLSDSQKTTYAAWEAKREKALAREQQSEDMPPPPPDGGDGPPPDGGGGPGGSGPPGGGGPPGV